MDGYLFFSAKKCLKNGFLKNKPLNKMTDTIDFLKTTQPNPQYLPPYSIAQGITAWRFSDLVRRKGYDQARWWAEFVRDRVGGLPEGTNLLTTFAAFCAAEQQQENADTTPSIPSQLG
jgi:hypothetical protein